MQVDANGLDVLDRDQCLELVRAERLGRLALTERSLPVILPVAYRMLDEMPVIRVGDGALRRASSQRAVCCFETDGSDVEWTWGWSVVMIGRIAPLLEPALVQRAAGLELPSWQSNGVDDSAFVQFSPEFVSGRRFGLSTP